MRGENMNKGITRRGVIKGLVALALTPVAYSLESLSKVSAGTTATGKALELYEGNEYLGYVGVFLPDKSGNKLVGEFLQPHFTEKRGNKVSLTEEGKKLEKILGLKNTERIQVFDDKVVAPSYDTPSCATLFAPLPCSDGKGFCEVRVGKVESEKNLLQRILPFGKLKIGSEWIFSSARTDSKDFVRYFHERVMSIYFKEGLSGEEVTQFGYNNFGMIAGLYLDGLILLQRVCANEKDLQKYAADIAFMTPFALYAFASLKNKKPLLEGIKKLSQEAGLCDEVFNDNLGKGVIDSLVKKEMAGKTIFKMLPILGPGYQAVTGDTDPIDYNVDAANEWYKKCYGFMTNVKDGDYVKAYLEFVRKNVLFATASLLSNKEVRLC